MRRVSVRGWNTDLGPGEEPPLPILLLIDLLVLVLVSISSRERFARDPRFRPMGSDDVELGC